MIGSRACILSVVVVTYLAGAGLAQSQTPAPSASPAPATPPATTSAPPASAQPAAPSTMTMEDVSKWTRKQWSAARAEWIKDKAKWTTCRKQAAAQNLSGRSSWQVIHDCMLM